MLPLLNFLFCQVLFQYVFLSEHLGGSAKKLKAFFRGRSSIFIGRPEQCKAGVCNLTQTCPFAVFMVRAQQGCYGSEGLQLNPFAIHTVLLKAFPVQVPWENTFAYFRTKGLAELRCRMLRICFSNECCDVARIRRGETATSLSSLVHSSGGDAGWTVLLPKSIKWENTG